VVSLARGLPTVVGSELADELAPVRGLEPEVE
jgi:hypothetical protein